MTLLATWESRITCNETYYSDSASNYSNVTITFQIRRLDAVMNGYNQTGAAWWSIDCDGQSSGYQYFNFNWNNTAAGTWWTVGSYSFKIPHNNDGSKTISYSGYYSTGITPASFSAKASSTLTKIPRYATFTSIGISDRTANSVTISWTADATCSSVEYYKDSTKLTSQTINASSGSYTFSGLVPNQTYQVGVHIKRSGTDLWTNSDAITVPAHSMPTITSNISFNIGEDLTLKLSGATASLPAFFRLYQKGTDDQWKLIVEKTNITYSTYVLHTSEHASALYANTPNSNTSQIKIACGTTVDGTEYITEYFGNARVVNSNPTMGGCTYQNTDSTSSNLLGNSYSMVTYYGNLRVTISQKATAKNSATISYYNISVSINGTTLIKKVNESTSSVYADFGYFTSTGTCTIRTEAVDSRGNISNILVNEDVVVYEYHAPTITANITRVNNFEREVGITLIGYISRVYTTSVRNTLQSLKYRYREVTGSWSSYYTISPTTSTSGNDTQFSYSNSMLLTLDTSKSYEFEFSVQDKLQTITYTAQLGEGIPLMTVADSGVVLIGEEPNDANLSSEYKLLVASDIVVRDSLSKQRALLYEIQNKIISSIDEPSDQMVGGLWLQEIE